MIAKLRHRCPWERKTPYSPVAGIGSGVEKAAVKSAHQCPELSSSNTYPNLVPFASFNIGCWFQSTVFWYTVLPHHCWIEFAPIEPFRGYCKLRTWLVASCAVSLAKTHQKNISTTLITVPASRAADRTSLRTQRSAFVTQGMINLKHTVVFGPEGETSAPDQILEYKPDHGPRNVIQSCCGWEKADATK